MVRWCKWTFRIIRQFKAYLARKSRFLHTGIQSSSSSLAVVDLVDPVWTLNH